MNKNIIFTILLIVTSASNVQGAYGMQQRNAGTQTPRRTTIADYDEANNPNLFEQMRQGYARQSNNEGKALFISSILDNTDGILAEKIVNVQTIAKVIDGELTVYTGWLWNENPEMVTFLQEQKSKIQHKLNRLEWQAKSFGRQTAERAATLTGLYLMGVLLAYVGQDQYRKITGSKEIYSYGDLSWLPIKTILDLAKNAVITVTGPTTQKLVTQAGNMTLAGLYTTGKLGTEAATSIGSNAKQYASKTLYEAAQALRPVAQPQQGQSQAQNAPNKTKQPNANPSPKNAAPKEKNNGAQNAWGYPTSYSDGDHPEIQQDNTSLFGTFNEWWNYKKQLGQAIDKEKAGIEQLTEMQRRQEAEHDYQQAQIEAVKREKGINIGNLREARVGINWKPNIPVYQPTEISTPKIQY